MSKSISFRILCRFFFGFARIAATRILNGFNKLGGFFLFSPYLCRLTYLYLLIFNSIWWSFDAATHFCSNTRLNRTTCVAGQQPAMNPMLWVFAVHYLVAYFFAASSFAKRKYINKAISICVVNLKSHFGICTMHNAHAPPWLNQSQK